MGDPEPDSDSDPLFVHSYLCVHKYIKVKANVFSYFSSFFLFVDTGYTLALIS